MKPANVTRCGIIGIVAAIFAPFIANAAIATYTDVISVITKVQGWMFGIFLVLAVIFILVSAYLFLGAADDKDRVMKAKSQLIYAIIAVGVAVLSRVLIALVQNFLQ